MMEIRSEFGLASARRHLALTARCLRCCLRQDLGHDRLRLHQLQCRLDRVLRRSTNAADRFGRRTVRGRHQLLGGQVDGCGGQRVGTATRECRDVVYIGDDLSGHLFDVLGQVEFGAEAVL